MRITLIISIILTISSLVNKIGCQVVLTRELLEQWHGDNLPSLEYLSLEVRKIIAIEPQAFNGLTNLKGIFLSYNQLSSIDPQTFDGLVNLRKRNIQ